MGTPFAKICQDKGNGNTVILALPQISLQRNAKYTVKVNSSDIKVKCLISRIVICIGEWVIRQLKLNILTALFILLLLPHEFMYSIFLDHDSESA